MKISELIKELNDIMNTWGDLPTYTYSGDGWEAIIDPLKSFQINKEKSFTNDRHNKEIIFPYRLTIY